jgi:hypothetical protein
MGILSWLFSLIPPASTADEKRRLEKDEEEEEIEELVALEII